jgi:hypothetical protein
VEGADGQVAVAVAVDVGDGEVVAEPVALLVRAGDACGVLV